MIGPTNYRVKRNYMLQLTLTLCNLRPQIRKEINGLISTLVTTCFRESNKVESRYLQEEVTLLQVESSL